MYYKENPDENLYQGDILRNFPIVILPDQLEIARPITPVSEGIIEAELKLESELTDAFSKGTEIILASAYRTNIWKKIPLLFFLIKLFLLGKEKVWYDYFAKL